MKDSLIDRFDKYMAISDLNDNKVTNQAQITNGLIGSARKRGKSLSTENIGKILYVYKDLNARWLLTGEGEMLLSEDNPNVNYAEINKYLDRIERLSEEVGRLKAEVDRLHSLLDAQTNKKTG